MKTTPNQPDNISPDNAEVHSQSAISKIWLLPILAVLIGSWMFYSNWSSRGQIITIEFEDASGLEAGVTKIKTRSVDIGVVSDIKLSETSNGVIVTAQLAQSARKLLKKDSRFWIVSPKIDKAGISGLSTLLSGAYIKLSPGVEAETSDNFVGLENAPITPNGAAGQHITLNSHKTFAFSVGDPIFYRDLVVGSIESVYFNIDERIVYYDAFIKAPYHKLLTTNVKFWRLSGLQVDITSEGISARMDSIESMIRGGLAFDVADNVPSGEPISQRAYFTVYADKKLAFQPHYQYSANIVIMVPDTVRGLSAGAPVEFKGLPIGRVQKINLAQPTPGNFLNESSEVPVLVSIDPGRLGLDDSEQSVAQLKNDLKKQIKKGLTASLQSGNLLTGSQLIEFKYPPNDEQNKREPPKPNKNEVAYFEQWPIVPYKAGGFSQLGDQASEFLAKLNQVPWQTLSKNTNHLLLDAADMSKKISLTSQSLQTLLTVASQEKLPENLNQTLLQLDQLAKSYSQGSRSYQDINETLKSMNRLMKELTPLIQQLKHKPNSLIFGNSRGADLIPQKRSSNEAD